jgi:hypothetical protein
VRHRKGVPLPVPAPLPYPLWSPVLSFAYGRWSKTILEMRRTSLRKRYRPDPQHSIFYAGEVVRSAIRGLGNSISEVAISFLVAAAVNACPQAALQIVRVAVGETPPKLHATIVAAAVADVPDPYEYVIVVHRREGSSEAPPVLEKRNAFTVSKVFATDGKSATPDSKSVVAEGKAAATEGLV